MVSLFFDAEQYLDQGVGGVTRLNFLLPFEGCGEGTGL